MSNYIQKNGLFLSDYILSFCSGKHELTKYRRLYLSIRNAILNGNLQSGETLPSSRQLAHELGYSRNTVTHALDQLFAEGYLETKQGAGTYVASGLTSGLSESHKSQTVQAPAKFELSRKAANILSLSQNLQPYGGGILTPGLPDLQSFPYKLWNKIYTRHSKQIDRKLTDFGHSGGYQPLRKIIAEYLRRARLVNCSEEQVFITCGTNQSLSLITTLLTNPGETVWIEDPGYPVAQGALQAADLEVCPVPLDSQGVTIPGELTKPRLIYTTPSSQMPTGIPMLLARRLELLNFCDLHKSWVIEDDYDGEFKFSAEPVPSLQGLNQNSSTLYLGTFSKILSPSLRVSYLVTPPQLTEIFTKAYPLLGNESSIITQAALEEFIALGYFETHIKRMRKLYRERREFTEHLLSKSAGLNTAKNSREDGGLHICVGLDDTRQTKVSDKTIVNETNRMGLGARSLSSYSINNFPRQGLIIGYTSCDIPQLESGLNQVIDLIQSHQLQLTDIKAELQPFLSHRSEIQSIKDNH